MSKCADATVPVVAGPAPAAANGKKYLYAIVYAAEAPAPACPGMDSKEISMIVEGRLAAVAGGTPGPTIRPERRYLACHQEVLKQLLAGTTPLPIAFGTMAEHSGAVRKILQHHQQDFLEQLERVAGKVEMGLRVAWDVPNIFAFLVDQDTELGAARDRLSANGREPTQAEKIDLGRMFSELLEDERRRHTERVEQILQPACFEMKARPCHAEREVMNLACLVDRRAQERFGELVFQAAQQFDNNFAFDYNGPWAPHNFVEVLL